MRCDDNCSELVVRSVWDYFYELHPHSFNGVESDVDTFVRFLCIYDDQTIDTADNTISSSLSASAAASASKSLPPSLSSLSSEFDYCSENQTLKLASFLADRKQWIHLQELCSLSRCGTRLPFQHLLGHSYVAQQQYDKARNAFEKAATIFGTHAAHSFC